MPEWHASEKARAHAIERERAQQLREAEELLEGRETDAALGIYPDHEAGEPVPPSDPVDDQAAAEYSEVPRPNRDALLVFEKAVGKRSQSGVPLSEREQQACLEAWRAESAWSQSVEDLLGEAVTMLQEAEAELSDDAPGVWNDVDELQRWLDDTRRWFVRHAALFRARHALGRPGKRGAG